MTYQDMIHYITRSIDVIIQAGRHEGARGITEFYLPSVETEKTETADV
jgi:type IV secretion system protein VirB11